MDDDTGIGPPATCPSELRDLDDPVECAMPAGHDGDHWALVAWTDDDTEYEPMIETEPARYPHGAGRDGGRGTEEAER